MHLVGILGGIGIAYVLIESGKALEALALLTVWIALLWLWPIAAVWMLVLMLVLGALALVCMFWEYVAAVLLALVLFVLLVGGLLHAMEVLL